MIWLYGKIQIRNIFVQIQGDLIRSARMILSTGQISSKYVTGQLSQILKLCTASFGNISENVMLDGSEALQMNSANVMTLTKTKESSMTFQEFNNIAGGILF